jgi:hypothetical protein
MITEAIWEGKKWRKGSSRYDIRHFIEDNYDVDESKIKSNLSSTLASMCQKGSNAYSCLKKTDDENENFKLTPEWRKEWTKKYGKKHPKKPRKTKKDPNHPKHPRNGYLYYSLDVRKRRQDQNPDKNFKEITALVAEEWRSLSTPKKKKYLDMAKKDRDRYQREMKNYRPDSDSESSSDSEEIKKKRKRAKRSDSEESKSHSAKKRKSRSELKSSSDSESDEEDKKKKKKSSSEKKEKNDGDEKEMKTEASSEKIKSK